MEQKPPQKQKPKKTRSTTNPRKPTQFLPRTDPRNLKGSTKSTNYSPKPKKPTRAGIV
jgi:hypothetical protein